MFVGILAGRIDIEAVMRMLDGGNGQAELCEFGDQTNQEGRLAATTPSRESKNFHMRFALFRAARRLGVWSRARQVSFVFAHVLQSRSQDNRSP